jgi:hypothetical protein
MLFNHVPDSVVAHVLSYSRDPRNIGVVDKRCASIYFIWYRDKEEDLCKLKDDTNSVTVLNRFYLYNPFWYQLGESKLNIVKCGVSNNILLEELYSPSMDAELLRLCVDIDNELIFDKIVKSTNVSVRDIRKIVKKKGKICHRIIKEELANPGTVSVDRFKEMTQVHSDELAYIDRQDVADYLGSHKHICYLFAKMGNKHILKFDAETIRNNCTHLAANGFLDIIRVVLATYQVGDHYINRMIEIATSHGHFHLVDYLRNIRTSIEQLTRVSWGDLNLKWYKKPYLMKKSIRYTNEYIRKIRNRKRKIIIHKQIRKEYDSWYGTEISGYDSNGSSSHCCTSSSGSSSHCCTSSSGSSSHRSASSSGGDEPLVENDSEDPGTDPITKSSKIYLSEAETLPLVSDEPAFATEDDHELDTSSYSSYSSTGSDSSCSSSSSCCSFKSDRYIHRRFKLSMKPKATEDESNEIVDDIPEYMDESNETVDDAPKRINKSNCSVI